MPNSVIHRFTLELLLKRNHPHFPAQRTKKFLNYIKAAKGGMEVYMFYEEKHSAKKDFFSITQSFNNNFNFPLHLHENYEFFLVEEGGMQVEICGNHYDLKPHEGALILPNQPHAYLTAEHSISWGAIFSPDLIPELKRIVSAKGYFSPIIRFGERDIKAELMKNKSNPLKLRSLLYELAAIYTDGEPAPRLSSSDSDTVGKLVSYIDAHYTEQLTLEDLSLALGYSYRYMSGVINKFFRKPLPQVVNRYRVSYACKLLTDSKTDISEIALTCGFGSMRSFNRNFKAVMGLTPREYRNDNK